MKNVSILLVIVVFATSFAAFNFKTSYSSEISPPQEETNQIVVPENVQIILDRSCLPCHGAEGSGKSKMKWNYEKMSEYSKSKLISKLVKVADEVEEEKMPPPKNLKKNPDRKLSPEEMKTLASWAESTADKMANE